MWLHIELNLCFVTIVFLHIFRCDHGLYNEYSFKDIKVN